MLTWGTGVRKERRSTRIPWDLRVEIASTQKGGWLPIMGNTSIVNLHGALIRTAKRLPEGENILMTVFSAHSVLVGARIVYSDCDSLVFGVELFRPRNIWGIFDVPTDWNLANSLS
jgi:hypothetical protein